MQHGEAEQAGICLTDAGLRVRRQMALAALGRAALQLHDPADLLDAAVDLLTDVVELDDRALRRALTDGPPAPGADDLVAEAAELVACASERYARERSLTRRALYEPLTGLPNRVLLADRADRALRVRRRTGRGVAAVYVDLDDIAGDEALREAARRLVGAFRSCDTVARVADGEFVVIAQDVSPDEARALVDRAQVALQLGASFGIALAGDDDTPTSLIAAAESERHGAGRAWPHAH